MSEPMPQPRLGHWFDHEGYTWVGFGMFYGIPAALCVYALIRWLV